MGHRYTREEDDYIISHYSTMSLIELSNILNRSVSSLRTRVMKRLHIPLDIVKAHNDHVRSTCHCDCKGDKNPGWKGGISSDNYHYKKLQLTRYPDKIRARRLTYNAIKSGKLKRMPCIVCGEIAQAHHDDYSKPYEIVWLCVKHHKQLHVEKEGIWGRKIKNQE